MSVLRFRRMCLLWKDAKWETTVLAQTQLAGIQFRAQDESDTSKYGFLDGVLPQTQAQYVRRRIPRRLYRTTDGTLLTADVNVAYIITLTQGTQKHPQNHFRD
jgi:hypothetical protein